MFEDDNNVHVGYGAWVNRLPFHSDPPEDEAPEVVETPPAEVIVDQDQTVL